jgi:RHS repeat-associated protein
MRRSSIRSVVSSCLLVALFSINAANASMISAGKSVITPSGAATYSMPIMVAPGTAGMVPNLSLEYNSRGGDGIVEIGWNLIGLSVINHCSRTLAQDGVTRAVNFEPTTATNQHRYCMNGRRLIAVSGTYGNDGTEYRTETDEFSKIVSYGVAGNGPASFKVWTKSGEILEYGVTADSRAEVPSKPTVAMWAMNKRQDRYGNYLTITYAEDNPNGELYPSRIDYTGNANTSTPTNNSVQFQYVARGAEGPVKSYAGGVLFKVSKKLTKIQSYSGSTVVTEYRLVYDAAMPNQLASITQCDGSNVCQPATTFKWVSGVYTSGVAADASSWTNQQNTFYVQAVASGDVNGDGYADVLSVDGNNGKIYISYSTGTGFGNKVLVGQASTNAGPADLNTGYTHYLVTLGDVNNDGKADIVAGDGTVWLSTGSGFAAPVKWRNFTDLTQISVKDANGDGYADMLTVDSNGGIYISYSTGSGFGAPVYVGQRDGFTSWDINSGASTFTPYLVSLGDIDGDGLADIVRSDGTIWLSTGAGFSASKQWEYFYANYSGTSMVMADINGDGLDDMITVDGSGNILVNYSTGSGYAGAFVVGVMGSYPGIMNPITLTPTTYYYTLSAADVNGDGLADIVRGDSLVQMATVSTPAVINKITDGLGNVTTFAYKTLTDTSVYTRDTGANAAVFPTVDLTEPLMVVSSVTTSNGIGGTLSTNHTYGGLKRDTRGRGDLGFRWNQIVQVETGITTRTEFRQDWPYVGAVTLEKKTLAGAGNGGLLSQRATSYKCLSSINTTDLQLNANPANCAVAAGRRYFTYPDQTVASRWDLNGTVLPVITSTSQYDSNGNPTQIIASADDGYTTTTINTFSDDMSGWLLGRLVRATVTSTAPQVPALTRTSAFEFDSVTGKMKKEIVEPDNTQLRLETSYAYDSWGNKLSATASSPATGTAAFASRTSSNAYDVRGQFSLSSTNALNQSETRVINANFGVMTSLTGPNGLTTTWQYDSFARKTREIRSDNTQTKWDYLYCSGVNGGTATCPTNAKYLVQVTPLAADGVTVNGAWVKTYLDSLEREVRSETQGFDGSIIVKTTEYDSKGRLYRSSLPYFSTGTPVWTVPTYDALNRAVLTTMPDGSTTSIAYSGLTTTLTNALSQTQTKITNSQGKLVQLKDAKNNSLIYQYDALGNLVKTIDPNGNTVLLTYDIRGRKTQMVDPDMGTWNYTYNALGELVQQTDAKSQVTNVTYDLLGRMTLRAEADLNSTWVYDTCTKGVGKLCSVSTDNSYQSVYTYDSYGRPISTKTTMDTDYTSSVTYDANGRVATQTYPTGFAVKYGYNARGYLQEVRNNATNALYWTANTMDAQGHLLLQTYGSNLTQTQQVFENTTGRLLNIYAGAGNGVQNLSYTYNAIGNLLTRNDANQNLSESFLYDNLNRVTSASVNSPGAGLVTQTFSYDSIGNITSRSDMGAYSYGTLNSRPHGLTQIALAGGATRQYTYDANGSLTQEVQRDSGNNIIASKGRTVTYTSYAMPKKISTTATPAVSMDFIYGPDHQRAKQVASDTGTTTYFLSPGGNGALLYEKDAKSNGSIEHRHFITVGGQVIAVAKTIGTGTTPTISYFHRDHLGSTTAVTNESGAVIERLAYEPFGKRRFVSGSIDPNNTIVGVNTDRGYTNHQHIESLGLINMNGRVYDPAIGRFLSADPTIPVADDLQSYNRYSYIVNNPLNGTDPSGFKHYTFSWGKLISPNQIIMQQMSYRGAQIWGSYMSQNCGSYAFLCAAASAYDNGRAHGYDYETSAEAGLMTMVFTMANYSIGSTDGWMNVVSHAVLGCVEAEAEGGSCRSAAIGAAVSAGMSQYGGNVNYSNTVFEGMVWHAMAGCLGARIAHGSCGDAARSAAYAYLYNECMHADGCVTALRAGRVVRSGWQDPNNHNAGAGARVQIQEPNGSRTLYGHLDPDHLPEVGTELNAGDGIANYATPTNGHSSRPHVHVQQYDAQGNIVAPTGGSPVQNGVMTSPYQHVDPLHPTGHQGVDYAIPQQ